jgi:CheY-like chemotaxis protein
MDLFEAVLSSDLISDGGFQDVDVLENEAFNRGLPATEQTASAGDQHNLASHEQPAADHLDPAVPLTSSAVILLIDDEKPFRAVVTQVLSKAGYEVVEAANGVEGINRFNEKPADLIITDIIMPEKEGIETMIELKKAHPRLKLIAMSGGGWYGTDIDFDMAKKLGARTLDKPFALQQLLDLIDELLNESV